MARWTLALLAGVLGAALAGPVCAQWKWRDQSGQTQYSDLPPPSAVAEQDILGRPPASRRLAGKAAAPAGAASAVDASASGAAVASARGASAPTAGRTVEPELETRRKKAAAEDAAKLKADEAKLASARADNCARARSQMQSLDSGVRIMRTNERGEREFLDDKQRAEESRRTRDVIAADCK